MSGYAIQFDGCPYLFTTQQVSSVPTTTDVNPVDGANSFPSGVILARGYLVDPSNRWTERALPLDGDLKVDSQSFVIYDQTIATGEAAGYPLISRLGTLSDSQIAPTTTELSASMTASQLTVPVVDATIYGSSGVVYVDQEAIHYTSKSGSDLVVPAGGRGYYGSRAVQHNTDPNNSYAPAVFGIFPGFERRRVVFWYVDDSNIASILWIGYCSNAPRFQANEATCYQFQCEAAWNIAKQARAGVPSQTTGFRGYRVKGITGDGLMGPSISYNTGGALPIQNKLWAAGGGNGVPIQSDYFSYVGADPLDAMGKIADLLNRAIVADLGAGTISAEARREGDSLTLTVSGNLGAANNAPGYGGATMTMKLAWGNQPSASDTSNQFQDPRTVVLTINGIADCLIVADPSRNDEVLPIASAGGLPTSWTSSSTTNGLIVTTVTPILMGDRDESTWVIVTPTGDLTVVPDDTIIPTVTLSGTFAGAPSIEITITTGGTRAGGLARFKWTSDRWNTYTSGVTVAATVVLGSTGLTANFSAGTYVVDKSYRAQNALTYNDPATGGAIVTGNIILAPKDPTAHGIPWRNRGQAGYNGFLDAPTVTIDSNVRLSATAVVASDHWLYAVWEGILKETTTVNAGADPRNWDDAGFDTIVNATAGLNNKVTYYLDGSRTFGELVGGALKASGCALGIRNGRITPFAIAPPMPTTVVAATLTSADYTEISGWARCPDGLANQAQIKAANLNIFVRDQKSIGRYGAGRTLDVSLPGTDDQSSISWSTTQVWQGVFSRLIAIWGRPVFAGLFSVSLAKAFTISVRDYVTITDWITPDGAGNRGPQSRTGQVLGKSVDLGPDGGIQLEVIFFDQGNVHGIAPCARVSSLSGSTIVVDSTSYLSESTTESDYANSTSSGYRFNSTFPSDGGASWFTAGDKIYFISRDETTQYFDGPYTISSVDPSYPRIILTGAIAGATVTYSASHILDVISAPYGNGTAVSDYQKQFSYVGSKATNVIGTSADKPDAWSP